jgi:sporulation protein YlmC with PRC-barrel domain
MKPLVQLAICLALAGAVPLRPVPAVAQTASQAGGDKKNEPVERLRQNQYRGSRLIGAEVYSQNGEKIGKVDDIVLEEDAKVSLLVINLGGTLGLGGKTVAVPISEIQLDDMKDGRITLKHSKHQLQQQTAFKPEYPDEPVQNAGSSGTSRAPDAAPPPSSDESSAAAPSEPKGQ